MYMQKILILLFLIPTLSGCSLIKNNTVKNNNVPKTDNSAEVVEVNQASVTPKGKAVTILHSKSNKYSSLKWQTVTIQEKNTHAKVNIKYPKFIGGSDIEPLNKYVNGLVLKILSDDKALIRDMLENPESTWTKNNSPCEGEISDYYPSCSVILEDSGYKIHSIINDVISLELTFADFTGGGAGNHEKSIIINYDLKTNRALKANELFCDTDYPAKLAPIVKASLLNDIMKPYLDIGGETASNERELIETATNPTSDNYNNILLEYTGITMVFPSYSIGPGIIGISYASLPFSKIPNIVCLP